MIPRRRKLPAMQVKAMDIEDVVNDKEWQKLRQSFVGTWTKTPEKNVSKLRRYLYEMKDPLRVRRVLNYLTGTGFRSGTISHPSITKLLNEVRKRWEEMLEQ